MLVFAKSAVDWGALGKEAIAASVFGIGIVVAFGLVLTGINAVSRARSQQDGGSTAVVPGMLAIAVGSAICLAALVVGFIAMTHKS